MVNIKFNAMRKLRIIILVFILACFIYPNVFAQDYDIVILNGRVMDPETNLDATKNIGIKDGKISVITDDEIEGKESIDAKGHVVCPGFIDLHQHIGSIPFGQKLALRDGVTTPLECELGAYPLSSFYDKLEGKSITNYGATISLPSIREEVLNPKYKSDYFTIPLDMQIQDESMFLKLVNVGTKPNKEQREKISELLEKGLKEGAIGIGNPVGYQTKGQTSLEMIAAQKIAAKYGLATFLHGRFSSNNPPESGILSVQEAIANVGVYGGGLLIQHMHQQTLANTDEALEFVDDARKNGLKVQVEIYPYNKGATIVAADYLVPENYGPNMGHDYSDIIEQANMKPLTKERYEELMKTNPKAGVIFLGIDDEGLNRSLAFPSTFVGSDAFPLVHSETGALAEDFDFPYEKAQGHPRASGTHARVLKMVREDNLVPLMLAISKMSYMPAKFMQENGVEQMARKGRIQTGMDADITIFDPSTVTDNATFDLGKNGLPSTGIPYVIVNGVLVVKDSKVLDGLYPGQAIRNKVE